MTKPQAILALIWGFACALGGIRTANLLIRRSEQQTVSSWAQGEAWAPRLSRWRLVWTCWGQTGVEAGKLPQVRCLLCAGGVEIRRGGPGRLSGRRCAHRARMTTTELRSRIDQFLRRADLDSRDRLFGENFCSRLSDPRWGVRSSGERRPGRGRPDEE